MERFRLLLYLGLLLFFGSIGMSRLSLPQVRAVDALGLFASGMGCSAALCGFIIHLMATKGLVSFRKQDRAVSHSAPEERGSGKNTAAP